MTSLDENQILKSIERETTIGSYMSSLEILDTLEMIARAGYERTKDPWWKEKLEWIEKQKREELERELAAKEWL